MDVPVVVPLIRHHGLLPGPVLERFVEEIFDKDGVTVLTTAEVPQLQFIIVGLGMHPIETVQKTVEFPQLPSRVGFVQFLDKVVATPVVVQIFDKVADVLLCRCSEVVQTCRKLWCSAVAVLGQGGHARCCERQVRGGVDVPVIMQRRCLATVKVPQIQFIAGVSGHSCSQQWGTLSAWVWRR